MTYQSDDVLNASIKRITADLIAEQNKYDARLAEIKAKEAEVRKEQQKRQTSQEKTSNSNTARILIQKSIDKGSLDSTQYRKVYERTFKLYGEQKAQELFVSSVISLLSHKHFGVESTTARFGNGGLTWKGKTYDSPDALRKGLLLALHGESGENFDPLGGSEWFDYVLEKAIYDPTFLPAEALRADKFPSYVQGLVAINKATQTNPVELPSADDLTIEDMLYLQDLFGVY